MAGYESSFIPGASAFPDPEPELRCGITDQATRLYSLFGIKFIIADETATGFGIQIKGTPEQEYDSQAILTLERAQL